MERGEGAHRWQRPSRHRLLLAPRLCTSRIARKHIAKEELRGAPPHPVPSILLARLAVDTDFKEQGLGRTLLIEALCDAMAAAQVIGWRVMEVDAPDQLAQSFYRKYGFQPSPETPEKLYLTRAAVFAAATASRAVVDRG